MDGVGCHCQFQQKASWQKGDQHSLLECKSTVVKLQHRDGREETMGRNGMMEEGKQMEESREGRSNERGMIWR